MKEIKITIKSWMRPQKHGIYGKFYIIGTNLTKHFVLFFFCFFFVCCFFSSTISPET